MITLILLVPIVIFCFFLLFIFSRQDFVLLRQNISLAQIFDLAAISSLAGIVFARIFSILNDSNFAYFHLLRFFHLVNFPGMSALGFFIGVSLGIFILFNKRKGLARIYDIFAISFFPLFVFLGVSEFVAVGLWQIAIPFAIFFILIFAYFVVSHKKYSLRDGSIAFIFLLLMSLTAFSSQFFAKGVHHVFLNLSFVQLFCIPLAIASFLSLFLNQKRKK